MAYNFIIVKPVCPVFSPYRNYTFISIPHFAQPVKNFASRTKNELGEKCSLNPVDENRQNMRKMPVKAYQTC